MAGVHVPSPVSHHLQEPFGFVSAAEGFIFLSACLSGLVYGKAFQQSGWEIMSHRVWQRVGLVYVIHLAVLIPVALAAWFDASRVQPLALHFHDFLQHPVESLALMPLLLHQPPLFDVLPLYVMLLLLTPLALSLAGRFGWQIVLMASASLWIAAQIHAMFIDQSGVWLPVRWGAFNFFAWQFLWFTGVALGEVSLRGPALSGRWRFILGGLAGALVIVGIFMRYGLQPFDHFNPDLYLFMEKWTLGPLRLLNFSAWVILLLAWNPQPPQWLQTPTALLGRHSLAVFAFHIPLVITAVSIIQIFGCQAGQQTVLALTVIASLFTWALWLERNAASRKRFAKKSQAEQESHSWFTRMRHTEVAAILDETRYYVVKQTHSFRSNPRP